MIAASAPIHRIDIAFMICPFLIKEAGGLSSQALSEAIAAKTLRFVRKVLRE
jgi:hypothetical protein